MKKNYAYFYSILLIVFCFSSLQAEESVTHTKSIFTLPDHWDGEWKLLGNLSFTNNDAVIGQADGATTTFGYEMRAALDWAKDRWEWKNSLQLEGAFSKTPSLSEFVKTKDKLSLGTQFLYSLLEDPKMGVFGAASLEAPIFKGKDVQGDASDYLITRQNNSQESITQVKSLSLTDPFAPLTLNQSLGVFYRAFDTKRVFLEIRTGAAAKEIFAKDQLILADDATSTNVTEVSELRNFQQLGASASSDLHGHLQNGLFYSVNADLMLPIVKGSSSGDKRNSVDLLNQKYSAKLEQDLMSWLSMSYSFSATKEPQLLDKFQVTHAFLLNFSHLLLARKEKS